VCDARPQGPVLQTDWFYRTETGKSSFLEFQEAAISVGRAAFRENYNRISNPVFDLNLSVFDLSEQVCPILGFTADSFDVEGLHNREHYVNAWHFLHFALAQEGWDGVLTRK